MKKFIYVMIMLLAAVATCQAAGNSNAKQTLYYIVLGSYQSLDNAKQHNVNCPDGLESSIVKVTVKGKTLYRAVTNCYFSKAKATQMARDINEHYNINAWVWPSNQRPHIVVKGTALSGDPIDLKPQR